MAHKEFDEVGVLRKLSLAVREDDTAFTLLWEQYHDFVYNTTRKMLPSSDDADEATQDVFLAIWVSREHLGKLREGDFVKYLYTVLKRVVYRHNVKKSRRKLAQRGFSELTERHEDNTDHHIREQQLSELYQLAVDGFPPVQRQVYKLIKCQGKSHEQIAEELHLNIYTVAFHMRSSYNALRRWMKPLFPLLVLLADTMLL